MAYLSSVRQASSRRAHVLALNKAAEVILRVNPACLDRFTRARLWRYVDWTSLNAATVRAVVAKLDGAPDQCAQVLSVLKGVARMARDVKRKT